MKNKAFSFVASRSSIFLIVSILAYFLNYIFNAILGRALSLEQFSILSLATTLWFLITLVVNSFSSVANSQTALITAEEDASTALSFRDYYLKKSILFATFFTVLWILLIPLLGYIFHTADYYLYIFLTPAIWMGIFNGVILGYFQGSLSYLKAAVLLGTEVISKVFLAIVFLNFGLHAQTYIIIPIAVFITFIAMLLLLFQDKVKNKNKEFAFPRKLLLGTFLTVFSSAAFLSIDQLFARHFLSETNSGSYALLALIGKVIFFIGSLLNVFILIISSREKGLHKNTSKSFYQIIFFNTFALLGVLAILNIFGGLLIPLLFGQKSLAILGFISPYTFGVFLFTISNCFAIYHLAKHQYIFAYNNLSFTFIALMGFVLFHNTISDFVGVILITSFLNICTNLILHVFYKDIFEEDLEASSSTDIFDVESNRVLQVAICLPAYNEEKNIHKLLTALTKQKTKHINIRKIVVISSACKDRTDEIVNEFARKYKNISLIQEKERKGKASAINLFLQKHNDEVIVIQSTDTIPEYDTIEKLCRPFLVDERIGMTGGAPIPTNDPNTFLGYVVHTWWWFHRNIPRFGEIVAFRNILPGISSETAVDEAYIQAKFAKMGYKIVHVDDAVVYNKGSETIKDMIKQRRRIFNGHYRLLEEENVKISHVTKSGLVLLLFKYKLYSIKHIIWIFGGIGLELYSITLAHYDKIFNKINPVVWDIASSTKNLAGLQRRKR